MPATAYDIVVGALQRCKVYAIGEPPTAAVGQIGLRTLNMMRAQMSAEGVACFGLQELTDLALKFKRQRGVADKSRGSGRVHAERQV